MPLCALAYVAEQHGEEGGRVDYLDEFVGLLARAAASDYTAEDEHHRIMYDRDIPHEIRVNMSMSYPCVSKFVRDHDLSGIELLKPDDYLELVDQRPLSPNHERGTGRTCSVPSWEYMSVDLNPIDGPRAGGR